MSRPPEPRVFVEGALGVGMTLALASGERRHLLARRVRAGERLVLLDGSGLEGHGVLREGGTVLVETLTPCAAEPRVEVTLVVSAGEPARVEWAVEKGTEAGAHRFLLAVTARCQAEHVKALAARGERLGRIAREAVKQCGRARVPSVEAPRALDDAVRIARRPLLVCVAGANAPPLEPDVVPRGTTSLGVVIGPAGGFTPEEEERLLEGGGMPVSLGPRVLRLETAAVVALARLAPLLDSPSSAG